jgi:hypothetical protein
MSCDIGEIKAAGGTLSSAPNAGNSRIGKIFDLMPN